MAWLRIDIELPDHPKTVRLASLLDAPEHLIVGHLIQLWGWAAKYAKDGRLGNYSHAEIARAAQWRGDATAFVDNLLRCGGKQRAGFLEECEGELVLHNWWERQGKHLTLDSDTGRKVDLRRAYEDGTIGTVRQRDGSTCRYCGRDVDWGNRRTASGGTYDQVDPRGGTGVDNLVVACRGCASQKAGRLPQDVGLELSRPEDPFDAAFNAPLDDALSTHLPTIRTIRTIRNDTITDSTNSTQETETDVAPAARRTPGKKRTKAKVAELDPDVQAVWQDWLTYQPAARVCPTKEIRQCLGVFSVEEIIAARRNAAADSYWADVPRQNGSSWFYAPRFIEKFRLRTPQKDGGYGKPGAEARPGVGRHAALPARAGGRLTGDAADARQYSTTQLARQRAQREALADRGSDGSEQAGGCGQPDAGVATG